MYANCNLHISISDHEGSILLLISHYDNTYIDVRYLKINNIQIQLIYFILKIY